jgi:hypothetical protein
VAIILLGRCLDLSYLSQKAIASLPVLVFKGADRTGQLLFFEGVRVLLCCFDRRPYLILPAAFAPDFRHNWRM